MKNLKTKASILFLNAIYRSYLQHLGSPDAANKVCPLFII